jgi:hypothetical protein
VSSKDKNLIPKKKKPLAVMATEPAKPEIPKDLSDKWGSVEAVATTFNLMQKGAFPHSYQAAVGASLVFLSKLHESCVEAALAHPESDLIPQLKELKNAKDGKADQKN